MAESEDKDLEVMLMEAGMRLQKPPSSLDQLLTLLDEVEICLAKVAQSPPESTHKALSGIENALVADELLKHSDVDVKVAVASCISEITRISAPDAPYDDDQMKDLFVLIVSSLDNLSDQSSRSYDKRVLILETVAKIRSCVVMLDLECDSLIVEMFQHFLKSIRDYHKKTVFTSMERIMSLVIEESDDISAELLTPILNSLKKDNGEIIPIARKLGEKVFENCATKLRPYLTQAVRSSEISLNDYSEVVAFICLEKTVPDQLPGGNFSYKVKAAEENATEASSHEEVDHSEGVPANAVDSAEDSPMKAAEDISVKAPHDADDKCQKAFVSNAIKNSEDGGSFSYSDSPTKPAKQSKQFPVSSKSDPKDIQDSKIADREAKTEKMLKTKRNSDTVLNSADPSDSLHIDGGKESEKLPEHPKSKTIEQFKVGMGDGKSQCVDSLVHTDGDVASEKASINESADVAAAKASISEATGVASPEALNAEDSDVASPIRCGSRHDDAPRMTSEGKSVDEVEQIGNGKKVSDDTAEGKSPSKSLKKEMMIGPKQSKLSNKKGDSSNKKKSGSSSLKQGKKKRGREKIAVETKPVKHVSEDDDKEILASPTAAVNDESVMVETPKLNGKRKPTARNEKVPFIGAKIKVWWPKDKMFYDGVIESYDAVKKKHKVSYNDGDEETLILKKERWEFIEDDHEPDDEVEADELSPDASSELQRKKKAKTDSDQFTKRSGTGSSQRGRPSSSKSNASLTRAGRKSQDDSKLEDATEDAGKAEDTFAKSKSRGARSVKMTNDIPKTSKKSKDDSRNKQEESEKTVTKLRGIASKSGAKSNLSGSGIKSDSKVKDKEGSEKKLLVSGQALGSGKRKPSETSKGKSSEVMPGKKRRRG